MERPEFIRHWTELESPDDAHYKDSTELHGIGAPLASKLGITRIGIHHSRLLPGRRTSYPHAESTEEEFVFVIEGTPDVWIDGHLHPLKPGDSVAFPAGTGICHTFINNTDHEVRLLIVGETSKEEPDSLSDERGSRSHAPGSLARLARASHGSARWQAVWRQDLSGRTHTRRTNGKPAVA
jgi:uncharacterized cupin superfamily protein